jgi:hypothetical protein
MVNGSASKPIRMKVILGSALPKQIAHPKSKAVMSNHLSGNYRAQGTMRWASTQTTISMRKIQIIGVETKNIKRIFSNLRCMKYAATNPALTNPRELRTRIRLKRLNPKYVTPTSRAVSTNNQKKTPMYQGWVCSDVDIIKSPPREI